MDCYTCIFVRWSGDTFERVVYCNRFKADLDHKNLPPVCIYSKKESFYCYLCGVKIEKDVIAYGDDFICVDCNELERIEWEKEA